MAEYPIEFTFVPPADFHGSLCGPGEFMATVQSSLRIVLRPSDANQHALARVACSFSGLLGERPRCDLCLELGTREIDIAKADGPVEVDEKIDTQVLAPHWVLVARGEAGGTRIRIVGLKLFGVQQLKPLGALSSTLGCPETVEEADDRIQKIKQGMEALVAMRTALLSERSLLMEQAPDAVDYAFRGSFYWEYFLKDEQGNRTTGKTLQEESQSFSSTVGANPRGIFVFSAPGHPPARWTALLRGLRRAGIPRAALFERKAKNWEMHFGRAVGDLLQQGLTPLILHKDGTAPMDDTLGKAQKQEVDFWSALAPHHQQSAKHMLCSDFFYEYLGFQERLEAVSAEIARRCGQGAQDQHVLAPLPLVSNAVLLECIHLASLLREHEQAGTAFMDTVKSYAQHCTRVSERLTEVSEEKQRAASEKEGLARGLRETIKSIEQKASKFEEEASKLKDSSEDSFRQSAEAKERGEWVLAQVAAPPQPEFF